MTQTADDNVVLAGRYRLLEKMGQGGMGSVWRAEHVTLRSPVAIKLIDPAIAQNEEALQRFMREAQAAAALRSPNVVQILDYGVDDGTPYIAMELMEGESLADRLERVGKLSPFETARVLSQTSKAITKAHEMGIVHRDLKPDNIFIINDGDEEIAKVLDFGIAKTGSSTLGLEGGPKTSTGALLGTPYYMSSEQASGSKVDWRTDLWALAVIAYECLTGKRPFEEENLGGLVLAICTRPIPLPSEHGEVPPGFDEWFVKGVQRDPDQRWQSSKEMTSYLKVVCGSGEPRASVDFGSISGINLQAQRHVITPAGVDANSNMILGATAQHAAPTSVTIGGQGTGLPKAAIIAAAAGLTLLIGLAGTAVFLLGRSSDASEPATAAETAPAEASAAAASAPAAAAVDENKKEDVLGVEDLPSEPIEADQGEEEGTAKKQPAVVRPSGPLRPAAPKPVAAAPKPAPKPAAPAPKPAAPAPKPAGPPAIDLGL